MATVNLYDLTRRELDSLVVACEGRPVHATRVWRYLYRDYVTDVAAMREVPARVRQRLESQAAADVLGSAVETPSDDGLTRKFLLELGDGRRIETVMMRFRGRSTACLSSQVGCALGCVFCATGQMGFSRNLSTGEIVAQAVHVARALRDESRHGTTVADDKPLGNVVLMGMGEPLLNYDAVMNAIDILCDSAGLAIGSKQLTLSTVGVVPGIVRLADQRCPCSLAVSLHAVTQDERAALVPAARTWPLDALRDACRYYTSRLERRIFFEWTLIEGRNDSPEHARALARFVRGIPAQINLIPLNPTIGYAGAPGHPEAVRRFQSILREAGLPVSVRQRRGIDIAAGCGQLAAAGA